MAEIFGNDRNIRGCFSVFRLDSQASRGAVLRLPTLTIPGRYSDPLLIVGFSAAQQESVSFTKVFGGRVYTYAFGHDPNASWLNVDFLGFLVNQASSSRVVENMQRTYASNRVTVTGRYAKLGLGTGGNSTPMRGFVVGLSTQTVDPQHSLQRFNMKIALVEAQQ